MRSNFEFLGQYWPNLQEIGKNAEEYAYKDPNASIIKVGMLAENIVLGILTFEKIPIPEDGRLSNLIRTLENNNLLPNNIDNILYVIRKARNNAVHNSEGSTQSALMLIHLAFNLSIWYMEVYGDWNFKAPQYIEPREDAEETVEQEPISLDYQKMLKDHEEEISELKKVITEMKTAASEIPSKDRAAKSRVVSEELQINENEQTVLAADKIKIESDIIGVVNYALQQNDMPIIRRITIINESKDDFDDCEIRITENSGICKPYKKHINFIAAEKSFEIQDINLLIDANYLSQLSEKRLSSLTITIAREENLLAEDVVEISFLPFDEWHGTSFLPELLTSFVTPNHPEVIKTIRLASQYLEKWTGDPSLDGYQTQDSNRVLQMVGAVYAALQNYQIVYAVPPESLSLVGQRIRLCETIVEQRLGTCIDISLFYASCLEAMGLHPILITKQDHVFVGCWLEKLTFSEAVQDDSSMLTKKIASGINEIAVVESTLLTSGKNASFDEARHYAVSELSGTDPIEYIIDVKRARLSGIRPLPVRIKGDSGWIIKEESRPQQIATMPDALSSRIRLNENDLDNRLTKTQQWERKLLDLGLRNNLINMRLTRNIIPLLVVSLDKLEDAMSDGSEFAIRPRPQDWNVRGSDFSFETMHKLGALEEVIESEYRNKRLRSAYSETELENAIKFLYRTARTSLEENGANTLYLALGLIRWYETARSVKARYAPVVLIPVEIIRKSAARGYVIRIRDEEPQVNITLLEKLKQDFHIVIGGLDPLPEDDHGLDIRKIFTIIRNGLMQQKRWDILESAYLGIFSFTQYVMWNDVRNHSDDLRNNKIVKSLIDGKLSWNAKEMEAGENVSEDDVILPIPTDASQLFAIKEASRGESFVLHGPPGTGKSQTITGMIGNALAKGKTVLFVAEKMAALEVVQKRLEAIGLGPFCLELHSNKSNKKNVLDQLQEASEVGSNFSTEQYLRKAEKISEDRKKLDVYVKELHKVQKSGLSIFETINRYEENLDFGDISESFSDVAGLWTSHDIEIREETIERLIESGTAVGHPHNHPLSSVHLTSFSQSLKQDIEISLLEYKPLLIEMVQKYIAFMSLLNENLQYGGEDAYRYARVAQAFFDWKEIPTEWCRVEDLNGHLNSICNACANGNELANRRSVILQNWSEEFLTQDGESLLSEWDGYENKNFISRHFAANKFIKRLSVFSKGPIQKESVREELRKLTDYSSIRRSLLESANAFKDEVGDLYEGEFTDWTELEELCNKTRKLYEELYSASGSDDYRRRFAWREDIRSAAQDYLERYKDVDEKEKQLYELYLIDSNREDRDWMHRQIEECDDILSHRDELRDWVAWNSLCSEATEKGLKPLVELYAGGLDHDKVSGTFKKSIYKAMSIYYIDQAETLNSFSGNLFNKQIEQYKNLDRELQILAQKEIYALLAAKVPNFTREASHNSEVGILQRAIRSRGRGTSIRKLFEQIPNLLPRLCPCMLMSPISVAQYLGTNRSIFDLVIFDEASQLPTCKAVGVLARGENAVIVGDPKQMPPTTFFTSNKIDEDNYEQEDMESILDDCLALNMPQTHLLWHYRSRHESLIAYSNSQFYENKLYTFPSVNDRETKVSLRHIDGVFERGKNRYNYAEAEAIVNELKHRAHDDDLSQYSVGIVTFNVPQQNLIDDLLTEACISDPKLEEWAYRSAEPLFIKNLENVQGDERDIILFSVSYGPDQNGRIYMNFGPLNKEGGWRRLNVAISRARYEMVVFSTLLPEQIDLTKTSAKGVLALKGFLEYAGGIELPENENTICSMDAGSTGIVDQICLGLQKEGYRTKRNVGKSKYKIDIGIIDSENEDSYIAGIILDGDSYGNSKSTRDREISQQDVLTGLGWNLIRVWTMDWWDNPSREMERILEKIELIISNNDGQQDLFREVIDPVNENFDNGQILLPMADGYSTERRAITDKTNEIVYELGPVSKKRDYTPQRYEAYEYKYLMSAEEVVDGYHADIISYFSSEIVDTEAPITESLLEKRLLHVFGITRSGTRIQRELDYCFSYLDAKVTKNGKQTVYWRVKDKPEEYYDYRLNGQGEAKREVREIPVEEIANTICHLLYDQISIAKEDIIKETGRELGFARTGTNVTEIIDYAVDYCMKKKRIKTTENNSYMLSDEFTETLRAYRMQDLSITN